MAGTIDDLKSGRNVKIITVMIKEISCDKDFRLQLGVFEIGTGSTPPPSASLTTTEYSTSSS